MQDIIKDYLSRASETQQVTGESWYWLAHAHAVELAEKHNVALVKVCGIIAALSPNNKWERNLYDTDLFLDKPSLDTKVCTFTANRIKALAIYNLESSGDDLQDAAVIMSILGGRKTRSFFDNIYHPLASLRVTVDLWMYRVFDCKASDKNYTDIELAVLEHCRDTGETPHVVQAVLWSVIRDEWYPKQTAKMSA